ncbi:arylsulfatase [Agromyces endophyticus]|uniref:arylsulfatase n=1 Tax=Agromyces sp. H17E-10 TaxID=2932244 RepID=UPI001FD212AF|nr:arylsulfatase [Agromyces sp. H17E-10]UOQ90187.1 arylsulfatase [Agromyces sp. H17E-10]
MSVDERGIPDFARGYDRHPGAIGRTVPQSQRAWPRSKRAPEGAPNVVVVLLDDLGFSDLGPFGSEIPTPNLDRVAASGVRLTNYHTTPVCSPARAALLTGLNPHRAGFASVANSDPGFPNLRLEIDDDVLTLPEILRDAGYATYMVGKWHLTRDALMNDAASKHTWPLQRGFDRYYGSLEGLNSFFHPNRLIRDNSPVGPETLAGRDDEPYYVTDDYTDQAISMISALRANDPDKPFLLYFAHTAMHGPLGAKPVDLARHRGRYAAGWDAIREARLASQKAQGLFPDDLPLPDRTAAFGHEVPAWDDLHDETQELYARHMEVYAAMVDNVDQNLGRLLDTLEQTGDLENTVVIVTSDNGGTSEGGPEGTRSYFSRFVHVPGLPADWDPDVERDLDLIGGPQAMTHYPRGWALASNTPFRYFKGQTFEGGVRVPFLLSWPKGLPRADGDHGIRNQFQYVTDVLPTILELAGVDHGGVRHNLPAQEIDGVSFASVARENAPSTRREQYSEFGGNRGFTRDGWKLVTDHAFGAAFDDDEWQLYDVANDPNELHDVSAEHPEQVRELAAAWEEAAWRNAVFPLGAAFSDVRRPEEALFQRPLRLLPGAPKLERHRAAALVTLRSVDLWADVVLDAGSEGVIVAHGDQGGGYSLWIEHGELHFSYNEYGRLLEVSAGVLPHGAHVLGVSLEWRPEFRWDVAITVDGVERARLDGVRMLVGMAPFSGIEVGRNSGGPVSWPLYERHGSFEFTGELVGVTFTPGERAPYDPSAVAELAHSAALYYD